MQIYSVAGVTYRAVSYGKNVCSISPYRQKFKTSIYDPY